MKAYNKDNIPLAKSLRKNMTPWERKLWFDFLRTYPIRFQRQKAVGNYILDFYCAKARLAIELDGGGHYTPEQAEKDLVRTEKLNAMKVKVIRFSNLDVDCNFSGVCSCINMAVEQSLPPSSEGARGEAPAKPPSDEGGGTGVSRDGGRESDGLYIWRRMQLS